MEEYQAPLLRFAGSILRDELYLLVEEASRLRILEAGLWFTKSQNEKTEAYLKELSQRNEELEKLIRDHLHTAR